MDNEFASIMASRSDAELLRIVNELKDDYQLEAVEAAEIEIKKTDLSNEVTLKN